MQVLGIYKSAMSLIIAANTDGSTSMENSIYRLAMSFTIATDSDGNAGTRTAYIDHLCHWLK